MPLLFAYDINRFSHDVALTWKKMKLQIECHIPGHILKVAAHVGLKNVFTALKGYHFRFLFEGAVHNT